MIIRFELWTAYATWYRLLADWASVLVPRYVANRLARYTLAEMFEQACRAAQTVDGPYMASLDRLYAMLTTAPETAGRIFAHTVWDAIKPLDEEAVCHIPKLYAAMYHMAYTSRWTSHDVRWMVALIRHHDPAYLGQAQLDAGLEAIEEITHPLRCGVLAMDNHDCGGELVCAASTELYDDEYARTAAWLARTMSEKGWT